jgi:hypothetical protein
MMKYKSTDEQHRTSSNIDTTSNNVVCLDSTYCQQRPCSCRMTYGPITIYRRRRLAPTLATGRRSKHEKFSNNDDERKREIRREKNRTSARNLRIYRDNIANELKYQIQQLESVERYLLAEIFYLGMYKLQLEQQYRSQTNITLARHSTRMFIPLMHAQQRLHNLFDCQHLTATKQKLMFDRRNS